MATAAPPSPAPLPTPLSSHTGRLLALAEVVALVGVLHGYLYLGRLGVRIDLAVGAGVGALALALAARHGEGPRAMGVLPSAVDLRALRLVVPALVVTAGLLTVLRLGLDPATYPPRPRLLLKTLAIYPVGALCQQAFYLGFVLRGLCRAGLSPGLAAGLAGSAYGLSHIPNGELTLLALPLGWYVGWVYTRAPALLPIALLHGVAGAALSTVVGIPMAVGARFLHPY